MRSSHRGTKFHEFALLPTAVLGEPLRGLESAISRNIPDSFSEAPRRRALRLDSTELWTPLSLRWLRAMPQV
jgi:hypothetical protein